ncbi:MAG: murein biosynthesis integral membrane protein MurJ [Candidatus Limnocylindrales bacterium]
MTRSGGPPMATPTPSRARPRWPTGTRPWRAVETIVPRGAIVLATLTFGGYVMGLVRDRIFARTFGAGVELDAYNAAFVLPELLLDVLVAGALVAPFVPIFSGLRVDTAAAGSTERIEAEGDQGIAGDAANEFGRSVLTLAVLAMAVTAAVLFVLAPQTTDLIAPGFRGDERDLYVTLFRIMCLTPVIFAASIVLGEILVADRRFFFYGLAPLCYNAGIVAGTVLFADRLGILAAAVGAIIGAVAHLAIRLVGVARTTFRPRPSFVLRTAAIGTFIRLMIPKMISQPIEPLTFLYFVALASSLDAGSVSSVSFARNFQSVPVSLIGASFAIAAFPVLSVAAAAGDRAAFSRVFARTLGIIAVLTIGAAVGMVVVGGLVIRLFLGGGAFDDADIERTTAVLVVFAISIPLESLTHLLSRAMYATQTTLIPSIASVIGFVATVAAAEWFLPSIGLAAIPASFSVGMAVKVAILSVALVPRVRRIGAVAPTVRVFALAAGSPAPRFTVRRGLAAVGLAFVLVVAGLGVFHAASLVASTDTIEVAPDVTPWARVAAAAEPEPGLNVPVAAPASSSPSTAPSGRSGGSAAPSSGRSPAPSPTPKPGPFAMDLYSKGDYVGEAIDTWCVAAAMQTSMNIMDVGADRTQATQQRLFRLARSLDPAPDGAAEPEGWAEGLTKLGYGKYRVSAQPSIRAAVQLAAKQLRATNRPVGLMVWRGAHSWVMSGFTATADPATTSQYKVTAVRIEDVWYPRFSTIWGYSRPPDALVPVSALDGDYLPWKRPRGTYPDKDGKYVMVIPVT